MSGLTQFLKRFLVIFNRKFFTFVFCFLLSGFFWMMLTLNDIITKEVVVPVTVTNVPNGYHLISDEVMNVNVTVSAQGISLFSTARNMKDSEATVNFSELVKKADPDQGVATLTENELLATVRKKVGSVKVTDVKPKELKIYFTKAEGIKVPVRLVDPVITPKEHYFLMKTKVEPDSVTVYAIHPLAASINVVDIKYFSLDESTEGNEKKVRMSYKAGVKYVPNTVTIKAQTDLLTEDTMKVRISMPNVGENLIIRTFPPSVVVRYAVPVSRKKDAKNVGFVVKPTINPERLLNDSVTDIVVSEAPAWVINPRLEVKKVGFLVEKN